MTRQCPRCADTGVVITDTWEIGEAATRHDCDCPIGRTFTATFLGPPQGTSHQLGEQAIDRHRAAMQAEGRYECFHCPDWHQSGTDCPEIKPQGWLAPQYRQIGETT